MILDIRPEPEPSRVEVRVEQRTVAAGRLDEASLIGKVQNLEAAMAAARDAGLFTEEQSSTFSFLYYCDGVDAFTSYLEENWRSAEVEPSLVSRARRLLKDRVGEIVILEPIIATRLSRGQSPEEAS